MKDESRGRGGRKRSGRRELKIQRKGRRKNAIKNENYIKKLLSIQRRKRK